MSDEIPVEYGPDGFLTEESSKRVAAMFDKDFPHGTSCDCRECLQREVARLREALEEQGRRARRDREHAVRANAGREAAREELREVVDELADRQKFLSQVIKERDDLFKERNRIARQAADVRDNLATAKGDLADAKEKIMDLESEVLRLESENPREVHEIYDKLSRTRLVETIFENASDALDVLSQANVDPRQYVVRSIKFERGEEP